MKKIFKKSKNILIGAVHFPPLLGFSDFPGFETALSHALKDLKAFEQGGVDAIVFENNYDIPHTEFVGPEITASMAYLGEKLRTATKLPMGISVLWNDYRTALSIAKILNLQFIRIPVFVDDVETSYGIIKGNADDVIAYRKKINAEHVLIFTDIHVKHSKILSKHSIEESAQLAIKKGSDGLIITGNWTGHAPNIQEMASVRKTIGHDFPIIVGSGTTKDNSATLATVVNAFIVSTSVKEGGEKQGEVNIKSYDQRIDQQKVAELVKSLL